PGMDPYLEDPNHWRNVHHGIISGSQAALNAQLRPDYFARVEERVYICPPDDPSHELYRIPDIQIVRDRPHRRTRRGLQANGGAVATLPVEIRTIFSEEEIHEYYLAIADAVSKTVV